MEFKIDSSVLKDCLIKIQGGLGGHTLGAQHVKMSVGDGVAAFYTNNIKIGYAAILSDVTIKEGGEAVVDGESLIRFISGAVAKELTLERKGNDLFIHDGKRLVKLSVLSSEEFTMPQMAEETVAEIDINLFKVVLKAALPMAAADGTIFDGIYMSNEHIISTDRNKAAVIDFKSTLKEPIIFTKEAAREMLKIPYEGKIMLKSNGNVLTVGIEGETESLMLTMKLLFGEFPDVKGLLTSFGFIEYVSIPIEGFYSEINYIALISNNPNQMCVMTVKDDGTIGLEAYANMETNRSYAEVDFDLGDSIIPDEPFVFNMRIANIGNMLRSIKDFTEGMSVSDGKLRIYFDETNKPIKVEVKGMTQLLSAIKSE